MVYVAQPDTLGGRAVLPKQRSPLATLPDVGQRLTDALEVGLLLRVCVEVILYVVAQLILGLILGLVGLGLALDLELR